MMMRASGWLASPSQSAVAATRPSREVPVGAAPRLVLERVLLMVYRRRRRRAPRLVETVLALINEGAQSLASWTRR
jgi:hypothetical protein